jgi:hypothetical protein
MHALQRVSLVSVILTALLLAPGCSDDDDPTTPESFQVTIVVTDDAGNPLEGLDLSMVPESPYYQDGKRIPTSVLAPDRSRMSAFPNPFNSVVKVAYELEFAGHLHLGIDDIEGNEIRALIDQPVLASIESVLWGGLDDQDQSMPPGIYTAHLVLRSETDNSVIFESSQDLLMANWGAERGIIATTDDEGKIVLKDRRLFPYLYDLEPFMALDENSDPVGTIRLTPDTRFYFYDRRQSRVWRFNREITGSGVHTFEIANP